MAVTVRVTGAVFNGKWKPLLEAGIKAAQVAVGDTGVEIVKAELNDVIIENTGAYVSTIASGWQSNDIAIHDDKVYGPWLEGVGSRNATSRFKGYWTFRQSTQKIQAEANTIATEAITPFVAQINLY